MCLGLWTRNSKYCVFQEILLMSCLDGELEYVWMYWERDRVNDLERRRKKFIIRKSYNNLRYALVNVYIGRWTIIFLMRNNNNNIERERESKRGMII